MMRDLNLVAKVVLLLTSLVILAVADSKTEFELRSKLAATEAARNVALRDKAILSEALLKLTAATKARAVGHNEILDATAASSLAAQTTAESNAAIARETADAAATTALSAKAQTQMLQLAAERGNNQLLISQVFILATLLAGYFVTWRVRGREHRWQMEGAVQARADLLEHFAEVQKTGEETKNVVSVLEKNTNSIMDRLLARTEKEALARGHQEGKDEAEDKQKI
jgi:hypothetical protein